MVQYFGSSASSGTTPRVPSSGSSSAGSDGRRSKDSLTLRHEPYNVSVLMPPPSEALHSALWLRVAYIPYPTQPFHATATLPGEDADLVRVFFGQLPYFVTDMQFAWLCATFGGGRVVANPERIVKTQPNGTRLPTGCLHAYLGAADAEVLCRLMHKRLLIDETGVWYAQNATEQAFLDAYIASLRKDRKRRVPGRPNDAVVVQAATSTYVPINPVPLTEMPEGPVPGVGKGGSYRQQAPGGGQRRPPPTSKGRPSGGPHPAAFAAAAVGDGRLHAAQPPLSLARPPPPPYRPVAAGSGVLRGASGAVPPPPPYASFRW